VYLFVYKTTKWWVTGGYVLSGCRGLYFDKKKPNSEWVTGVSCGLVEEVIYLNNNLLIGGILVVTCGLDGVISYFDNNLLIDWLLVVTCCLDGVDICFDKKT
jgi:hypothetical protein